MIRLQAERERRSWSKQRLSYEAHVAPQTIGQVELGNRKAYPAELARIAEALGFTGEPAELLEEVDSNA